MFRYWKLALVAGVAALAIGFDNPARAAVDCSAGNCTITNDNATVVIDPDSGTNLYTFTFEVDGVDHLFDQSFWYRLSTDTEESPVASIPLTAAEVDGSSSLQCAGEANNCLYAALYTFSDGGDDFTILITYKLVGGTAGSGTADLVEQITITNTGSTTLTFDFFEYNDFDLDGSANDLSVALTGTPENTALQVGSVTTVGEVVVGNTANLSGAEVAVFPSIITRLLDASVDDFTGTKSLAGLADYEFIFQWTFTLGPTGTFLISKNKLLQISEPATLVLFGFGLITLAFLSRRRRHRSRRL